MILGDCVHHLLREVVLDRIKVNGSFVTEIESLLWFQIADECAAGLVTRRVG